MCTCTHTAQPLECNCICLTLACSNITREQGHGGLTPKETIEPWVSHSSFSPLSYYSIWELSNTCLAHLSWSWAQLGSPLFHCATPPLTPAQGFQPSTQCLTSYTSLVNSLYNFVTSKERETGQQRKWASISSSAHSLRRLEISS